MKSTPSSVARTESRLTSDDQTSQSIGAGEPGDQERLHIEASVQQAAAPTPGVERRRRVLLKRVHPLQGDSATLTDDVVQAVSAPDDHPERVDLIMAIFSARRDLIRLDKNAVEGTGLGIEDADLVILLYGLAELGWTDCDIDDEGYVRFRDIQRVLTYEPSGFSRRIHRLAADGWVETALVNPASTTQHGNSRRVRLTSDGLRRAKPIYDRYRASASSLLEGAPAGPLGECVRILEWVAKRGREENVPWPGLASGSTAPEVDAEPRLERITSSVSSGEASSEKAQTAGVDSLRVGADVHWAPLVQGLRGILCKVHREAVEASALQEGVTREVGNLRFLDSDEIGDAIQPLLGRMDEARRLQQLLERTLSTVVDLLESMAVNRGSTVADRH